MKAGPIQQVRYLGSKFSKRVRRNFQDHGLRRTIMKIAGSLGSLLFYTRAYTIYRADLGDLILPGATDESLVFRFLEPTEKNFLIQIQQMEEWLDTRLDAILESGGKCLAAIDGTRVAGFNLVSFQQIHLPVIQFTRALRPGGAYSEQITVSKAYRGRNLGSTLRLELFRALKAQGTRSLYGGTDVNNHANLALCRKVGLKGIVDIRHFRIFGLERKLIKRRRS